MRSTIRPATRLARVAACLALLNLSVPGGAIVTFGVPAREAIGKALAARAKAAKELEARRRRSASRLLTDDEQAKMQGRTGENPYLAGGSKWDVVYKGVDLMTGNYGASATDLSFDGGYGIPVNVTRSYSANQADEGPFGKGWTLSADVRSTAGGLLKGGSAPVRSIPTSLKERSDAEADPNLAVQPTQAVTAVDAGGTEETVQKDVDGVLTTPAWDKNVYDSQYEWVTLSGASYQVLVSNTVKTPEGTVYTYAKEGTYPYGTTPWDQPNAATQAANVLKVTSATDRQGNVTTYSYGSGTVTFNHPTGTTVEHPLTQVSMPGGHVIALTWGTNPNAASYMRLVSVSDGPRTVTYAYTGQPGHGLLASATSAGGKTTSYGYGSTYQGNDGYGNPYPGYATNLLNAITDPRGLTTQIVYQAGYVTGMSYYATGYSNNEPGVSVDRILWPNGTKTFYEYKALNPMIMSGNYLLVGGDDRQAWANGDPGMPTSAASLATDGRFVEGVTLVSTGNQSGVVGYGVCEMADYRPDEVSTHNYGQWSSAKSFSPANQDLLESWHYTYPYYKSTAAFGGSNTGNGSVAADRGLTTAYGQSGMPVKLTHEVRSYNFMGQPLSQTSSEGTASSAVTSSTTTTRTATMGYAYWGADKYWQQKATRDQAGRYSYTDYYANAAPAGKRGQVYRVYDPKYGGIGLNTNATVPGYAAPGTAWRYQVTPAANQYAAQFDYDAQGRPVDVWKLQSATSSPYAYVRTHTTYGGDGSPSWGQASQVVEDYGGINRTTTTQAYTSWGKASDVIDAAGHEFVTSFDLDGKVNSVTRKDGGLNQTIVAYAYGSSGIENGQPTSVTDGFSGVTQAISYCQSGASVGMPASVTETNGSDSYSVAYTYGPFGDRATATYATPSGTQRWGYGDYVTTGDAASPGRAFQTLWRLDASGAKTPEELHYAFDTDGRLVASAFAQTPLSATRQGNGGFYGVDAPEHSWSRRARAAYEYDPAGRLTTLAHYWDHKEPNARGELVTVSDAILGNTCAYETSGSLNRGLKTSSTFWSQSASDSTQFSQDRTETYGYDAQQDQLTSASYGDGLPSANPSWTYDAAGNRNDAVTDNLNRATSLGGASVMNDVLGNRLTKGGTTYGWDCLNRMTSLSGAVTASYQYRADGMRVVKQTGGVTTLYHHDGQMGVEDVEVPASGAATVTRYGLGARGVDMIERTNSQGTVTAFPIYDAHGNNVASLTRNGSGGFGIGDRRTYDAWGVVRAQQSGGDPKLRYCASLGHKADDESGLIYMRARYYEPSSGRFVSEDPGMSGKNWFSYCSNNPVNRSDYSGKSDSDDIRVGLYALAGFLLLLAGTFGGVGALEDIAFMKTTGIVLVGLAMAAVAGAAGFDDRLSPYQMLTVCVAIPMVVAAMAGIAGGMKAGEAQGGIALIAVTATAAYSCLVLELEVDLNADRDPHSKY